jgi:hypothetical protein
MGNSDMAHASTSYVESQSVTPHAHAPGVAVILHVMHGNFARMHQTLRVVPDMEAGVSDQMWEITGIVGWLDWAAAHSSSN